MFVELAVTARIPFPGGEGLGIGQPGCGNIGGGAVRLQDGGVARKLRGGAGFQDGNPVPVVTEPEHQGHAGDLHLGFAGFHLVSQKPESAGVHQGDVAAVLGAGAAGAAGTAGAAVCRGLIGVAALLSQGYEAGLFPYLYIQAVFQFLQYLQFGIGSQLFQGFSQAGEVRVQPRVPQGVGGAALKGFIREAEEARPYKALFLSRRDLGEGFLIARDLQGLPPLQQQTDHRDAVPHDLDFPGFGCGGFRGGGLRRCLLRGGGRGGGRLRCGGLLPFSAACRQQAQGQKQGHKFFHLVSPPCSVLP